MNYIILVLLCLSVLNSCGKKNNNSSEDSQAPEVGVLQVEGGDKNPVNESLINGGAVNLNKISLAVEFGKIAVNDGKLVLLACDGNSTDNPEREVGDDCDNNGGKVAFQTPSKYKLAFKSLYINFDNISTESNDITKEYLINFESLDKITSNGIYEFTPSASTINLNIPEERLLDNLTSIGYELYYYEVEIKMYGEMKTIRIYMSDDDFPSQGSGGHHQGDITYFDSAGVEHWANGGSNWFSDPEATKTRGAYANGAGGVDVETNHNRGMFGDQNFWNSARNNQGANQDVYAEEVSLNSDNPGRNYFIEFNISDTWYYEDFEISNVNSFDPCLNSTIEGCGASWAPLFPTIEITSDETSKATDSIKIHAEDRYQVKSGVELIIDIKATSSDDLTIIEETTPNGALLSKQEGTKEAIRKFSWTPSEEEISEHLLSYMVRSKEDGAILHAIVISVID